MRTSRRGQSIVEYLVVTAAVIAAIVAVRGAMQSAAQRVMSGALDTVPTENGTLGLLTSTVCIVLPPRLTM